MSWEIFTIVKDFMINNIFGSTGWFALFLIFAFFMLLLAARINPLFSFLALAPLTYGLALNGWFGAGWVQALVILILSLLWAFVVWLIIGEG